MIDIINRVLSCNLTSINGCGVVKNKGAKLEVVAQDKFYPYTSWVIELCKTENINSNELQITGSTVLGFSDNAIGFSDTVIGF
jgi:hypothetical protein